jgi:hypothetical protein
MNAIELWILAAGTKVTAALFCKMLKQGAQKVVRGPV